MTDYKAAFERERKARKISEQQLETIARELYLKNAEFKAQCVDLESEAAQKSLLLTISSYSQDQLKLKNLLPIILMEMLKLGHYPFGIFDYMPIHDHSQRHRSQVHFNPNHSCTIDGYKTDSQPLEAVINNATVDALYLHEPVFTENPSQQLDKQGKLLLEQSHIQRMLTFPVIVNQQLSSVLFLFSENTEEDERLINVFSSALSQLGHLIEHRYNEEKLSDNYQRLKDTYDELKFTQRQLVQSEKLASIGQLSAGIAHEINNPMGFIKSNVNSLTEYLPVFYETIAHSELLIQQVNNQDNKGVEASIHQLQALWEKEDIHYLVDDSKTLVNECQQGIDRIIDIVAGLKQFSRRSKHDQEAFDINECLEEAIKLAHNEIKYKATIEKSFCESPVAFGSKNEIIQVFINLIVNAAQAIEKKGTIYLSTVNTDSRIFVEIRDTGAGIDDADVSEIFNPFFTTKPIGQGTGLGLSISYGIIDSHDGKISVKSQKGKGTTFSIRLPTYRQEDQIEP